MTIYDLPGINTSVHLLMQILRQDLGQWNYAYNTDVFLNQQFLSYVTERPTPITNAAASNVKRTMQQNHDLPKDVLPTINILNHVLSQVLFYSGRQQSLYESCRQERHSDLQ